MNNLFSYNGIVTVATQINNKIISRTKYHNTGTKKLFEAYARALSGQPIPSLIPSYIDMGNGEHSILKNKLPITVTYMGGQDNVYDVSYDYDSPFTRVSAILTKNMMATATTIPENVIAKLETTDGTVLAEVELLTLGNTIKNLGNGIQLILLWDLYVVNE